MARILPSRRGVPPRRLLAYAVGLLLACAGTGGSAGAAAPARAAAGTTTVLPATLEDVRGETLDVADLATRHRLVFVTLKATWCGVCRQQLARLRAELPRLQGCGVSFVVLSPGPRDELRRVAESADFPFPFVEDRDLALARSADLVLAPGQIVPALFTVNERREIDWVHAGRSGVSYGDAALLEHLGCARLHTARAEGIRAAP